MLTLLGMGSPNVGKVVLMLEEVGLPYRFERCDVIRGAHRNPDFAALNPNGKVPVLIGDKDAEGAALSESGAILIYLAERSGRFLAGKGPARYAALQWLMFQMAGVGPVLGHSIHLSSFARQEPYALTRFTNEMRRIADVIDRQLSSQNFLAGPDYSIADMALYPWARTAAKFFPDIFSSEAITAWTAAIGSRPAAIRAQVLLDEQSALDRDSFRAATPEQLDRYFGRTV
ncbi:MAG: glutathione S-transferase N-terminal domain-containing protein [Sphingobium sp.]